MESTTGKTLAAFMPATLPDGTPVTFSAVMSLITKEQWTRVRVFSISPRQGMLQARPAVAAHIGVTPATLEAYLKYEFVTRSAAGRAAASARRKAEREAQHERDADAAQVGAMVPGMVYRNGRGGDLVSLTQRGEAAATASQRKAKPPAKTRPALKFDAAPAAPGAIVIALRPVTILQARDLPAAELAKPPAGTHTGLTAEVTGLLADLKPGKARALLVADMPTAEKVRQAILHAVPALGWKAARLGGYKTWTRKAGTNIELVIHRLV